MKQNGYHGYPLGGGVVAGRSPGAGGGNGAAAFTFIDSSTTSGGVSSAAEFPLSTVTIPSGTIQSPPTLVRVTSAFQYTTSGTTPQLTIRVRRNGIAGTIMFAYGGATVNLGGAFADFGTVSNAITYANVAGIGNIRTIFGWILFNVSAFSTQVQVAGVNNSINGVDLFAAQTVDVTGQFNASGANNQVLHYGTIVEVLRSAS